AIETQLKDLSSQGNIFTGDRKKQLTYWPGLSDISVYDLTTAIAAINTIIDKGEGSGKSPMDHQHELAHYYRYAEIYHGYKLIPQKQEPKGYAYAGDPIPFEPAGVWPVITNPSLAGYAPGSLAANLNDTFNYTYTNLLKSLHTIFNGADPDKQL